MDAAEVVERDPRSIAAKKAKAESAKTAAKPAPKKDDEKPAATRPAPSNDNAAAERKLELIETLISANRKDKAREKLKEIIDDYAGTEAAKKAKKMLEDLK